MSKMKACNYRFVDQATYNVVVVIENGKGSVISALVLKYKFRRRSFSLNIDQSRPVAFAKTSFLPPTTINLWTYPEAKQLRVHLLD